MGSSICGLFGLFSNIQFPNHALILVKSNLNKYTVGFDGLTLHNSVKPFLNVG